MKIKMAKKGIKKIGVVDRISKNRRGKAGILFHEESPVCETCCVVSLRSAAIH